MTEYFRSHCIAVLHIDLVKNKYNYRSFTVNLNYIKLLGMTQIESDHQVTKKHLEPNLDIVQMIYNNIKVIKVFSQDLLL